MIELYHGSPFKFDVPDVSRGKAYRDFGVGFYMAENENDSLSIAVKNGWVGYCYTFEVEDELLFSELSVLEFDGFEDAWFEFVYRCRIDGYQDDYDVVIGPTAGGCVNDLFEGYRYNETTYEQAFEEMRREITQTRFGIQWCFASERSLDFVRLVAVEEITR